jgi:hypothetical protein
MGIDDGDLLAATVQRVLTRGRRLLDAEPAPTTPLSRAQLAWGLQAAVTSRRLEAYQAQLRALRADYFDHPVVLDHPEWLDLTMEAHWIAQRLFAHAERLEQTVYEEGKQDDPDPPA